MVTSLWIVLLMTIELLWSPKWTLPISANVVLYILKSLFSPFRMTIYHMLSVRQVVWRVKYTRPNLPQAEWLVMGRLLCCVIDTNDGYVHIFNWGRHSDFKLLIFYVCWTRLFWSHSYTPGRIAQSVVYRLHVPKVWVRSCIQLNNIFSWENARNNILMYGACRS